MDWLFAPAFAQEAVEQPNFLVQFAPFIVIFFIFYFLMIRPQKKRMMEEQNLLNSLNKGDEIYTKSGIIGTITGLTEKVVTLEVSQGVKMKVLRSHVAGLAQKLFDKKEPANS
jgi:preprotein translocase subunit YajC